MLVNSEAILHTHIAVMSLLAKVMVLLLYTILFLLLFFIVSVIFFYFLYSVTEAFPFIHLTNLAFSLLTHFSPVSHFYSP